MRELMLDPLKLNATRADANGAALAYAAINPPARKRGKPAAPPATVP